MHTIIMYKTPNCKYCKEAAIWFSDQNIPFTVVDVSTNKEEREKMIEMSGQMGVPVIVVDNKDVVIGFNKKALAKLLDISDEEHKS